MADLIEYFESLTFVSKTVQIHLIGQLLDIVSLSF